MVWFLVVEHLFLFKNVLYLFTTSSSVLGIINQFFMHNMYLHGNGMSSFIHQTVIMQSSDSHQTVILIHLILSGLELHCTLYYITITSRYTEALKLHCFLKKNLLYYIGINLTKCGFELHGFFLEPTTAYLEALL